MVRRDINLSNLNMIILITITEWITIYCNYDSIIYIFGDNSFIIVGMECSNRRAVILANALDIVRKASMIGEFIFSTELSSVQRSILGQINKSWVQSHISHGWLFATPWTVTFQAPLSSGILQARVLEWVSWPPSGDCPDPGIEPVSLASPAWQADPLPLHHLGSPGGHEAPNKFRASTTRTQGQWGWWLWKQGSGILSPTSVQIPKNKWDFLPD